MKRADEIIRRKAAEQDAANNAPVDTDALWERLEVKRRPKRIALSRYGIAAAVALLLISYVFIRHSDTGLLPVADTARQLSAYRAPERTEAPTTQAATQPTAPTTGNPAPQAKHHRTHKHPILTGIDAGITDDNSSRNYGLYAEPEPTNDIPLAY
jgi:hypothetical protein